MTLALLLLGGRASAAPPSRPAGTDAPTTRPDALSDGELESLAASLGDPLYATRERATARLSRLAIDQIDRLVPIYRRTLAPEVLLRLQLVARNIFIEAKESGRHAEGFLGITHVQEARLMQAAGGDRALVEGARVMDVLPDSPASAAGLKPDDFIFKVNGRPVTPMADGALVTQIRLIAPGTKVKFTVQREGKELVVTATLGNRRKFHVDPVDVQEWDRQFEQFWQQKFESGHEQAALAPDAARMIQLQGGGRVFVDELEFKVFDARGVEVQAGRLLVKPPADPQDEPDD